MCFSMSFQTPWDPCCTRLFPDAVGGCLGFAFGKRPWLSGLVMTIPLNRIGGEKCREIYGIVLSIYGIVLTIIWDWILLYLPNISIIHILSIPCPPTIWSSNHCFDHGMDKCRRHAKASSADSWVSPTEWENNSAMLALTPGMLPKDAILASKHNFLNCNLAICDDRDISWWWFTPTTI